MTLLPVVSVLLASALFGGLVRPRHSVEAALLCCTLVMLSSFRLPAFVDGDSRFEWERFALSTAAALSLWSAAKLGARHSRSADHATAPRKNSLVGFACFIAFGLLVASASYSSVVYRTAVVKLPQAGRLTATDSPENTWFTLPFAVEEYDVSPFALAVSVCLIGGAFGFALRLLLSRTPEHVARIALRAVSASVALLVVLGLVVLVIAANWPASVNPVSVTRHVYDWAVVAGSLSVMLGLRDRSRSTLWFATALGAVVAVRTAEQARYQMFWDYHYVWHEFTEGVLLRAAPLGLAVGLAASRWAAQTGKRRGLGWIWGGCLTIACALLSLDGLTWYAPYRPDKRLSHTTVCVEEVPGLAYRFPSAGSPPTVNDWRLARYHAPKNEGISKALLYASLDDAAVDYLPVLAEIATYDLPLYVYASYLESIDLWTVPQFYVSNSSCAIAGASLGRLRNEPPPPSVHSVRQLMAWLGNAS